RHFQSSLPLPTALADCPLLPLKRRFIRIPRLGFRARIGWCVYATSETDHSAERIVAWRGFVEVSKLRVLANELELDAADGTVSVLCDDNIVHTLSGQSLFVDSNLVVLRTIKEHDDISVLFDGTRLTQVRQLRPLVATTGFNTTA